MPGRARGQLICHLLDLRILVVFCVGRIFSFVTAILSITITLHYHRLFVDELVPLAPPPLIESQSLHPRSSPLLSRFWPPRDPRNQRPRAPAVPERRRHVPRPNNEFFEVVPPGLRVGLVTLVSFRGESGEVEVTDYKRSSCHQQV